jgi:hypothetical protein
MTQPTLFDWAAQSRRESNHSIDRAHREAEIVQALREMPEFRYGATAYELTQALNRNITSIRPRLTEMVSSGRLVETGRKVNPEFSPKACTVYILPEFKQEGICLA